MIPTKISVIEIDYRWIRNHLDARYEGSHDQRQRARYLRASQIWHTISYPQYVLDLRRFDDKALWDLWGVIPANYIRIRQELARYLERSPLIKLAECAE